MDTIVGIFMVLSALALLFAPTIVLFFWDRTDARSTLLKTEKRLVQVLKQADIHRIASENASDGLLVQDMQGHVVWCNPAYCRIHGRELNEILGRNPLEFAVAPVQTPSAKNIKKFRYDPNDPAHTGLQLYKSQHKKGHIFWNQVSVSFKKFNDGREYAIAVCRDVTEQIERTENLRVARERLQIEATHDGLTGVANRAAFVAFCENALKTADRAPVGLLHIDLDNFKSTNDTHGHSAGDAVLKHIAAAILSAARDVDLVARVGGDEFVMVCPGTPDLAVLNDICDRLLVAISIPFEWSNHPLRIEASIGAALSPDTSISGEDLLVQADFALYVAKRNGRSQVALYDQTLRDHHEHLMSRSAELVDAVETAKLDFYFQPTLDLRTGAVTGFETLVRWNHPTEGIIPPDDFLPLAKDLGLLGTLDLLSMAAALDEKCRLASHGYPDMKVAFNASPELLSHPDFLNRLTWGAEAGNIKHGDITIEVLETTDFGDPTQTSSHAALIHDLRSSGFQIHLDDFGVGFAGLSHLASLSITGVKVDRSLVKEILTDQTCQKIVRKIVELANDMGLCVIAEGVENQQTATVLHDMGCNVIQGYWLSRPLPQDAVLDWLEHHSQTDQENRA